MATDRQTRILADEILETKPKNEYGEQWVTHMITAVEYHKGGTNVFTGNNDRRGYHVVVRVSDKSNSRHGGTVERFGMFDGLAVKALFLPAHAFSAKKLEMIIAPPETVAALRAKVLARREELRQEKIARAS